MALPSGWHRGLARAGEALLGIVLPWECVGCGARVGEVMCRECGRGLGPRRQQIEGVGQVWVMGDYGGGLAEGIKGLKYRGKVWVGRRLGWWMGEALKGLVEVDVVVPVALHWRRRVMRGFNQAAVVGWQMARVWGAGWMAGGLKRLRPTRAQVGLGARERRENVAGAFAVRGLVKGLRVGLVDDVVTTGATMSECARVLRQAGAREVVGLALARAGLEAGV